MEYRGLQTSKWAGGRGGYLHNFSRLSDWNCPSCGFSNFQRRTECLRCSFPAPASSAIREDDSVGKSHQGRPNETPPLLEVNHQTDFQGHGEGTENSPEAHVSSVVVGDSTYDSHCNKEKSRGLITSRWAPRNRYSMSNTSDDIKIWTKIVVPSANVTADLHEGDASSPLISNAFDLGPPYEVQHYIISLIQRTLEEACYDFASRWIPDTLSSNNWTCAEAVELSIWQKVLPTANLPSNVISPLTKKYSLASALADAVRIRNAAVHRHLCSTIEIRLMASKAQVLMAMFADETRWDKLRRLGDELDNWDREKGLDERAKRSRLQESLQEISERLIDDMDWTPNEVSLMEIRDSEELGEGIEKLYMDRMELG